MKVGGFQHGDIGTQTIRQRLGLGLCGVWLAGASGQEEGSGKGGEAGTLAHGAGSGASNA
ncbi:hypothetical protein GCM10010981_15960 [Dyella nitratireducens]|uniref:Uncharacterized protein n=1 Tax=Dyella nitratireducens TaxID=1849580 RepID=A0ABQ1FTM1_9GAMM|nr:hypothetical protein GCM10010981_15960 [Dyella nitratireducens]GLQ43339.1 hypothetical protein GCM10007902_31890 [Dyella nitratireducens]